MNKPIALAALGMAATLALHAISGEFTVHRPLLADVLSAEMDLYVSVVWHGITAVIAINTIALVYAALQPSPPNPLLWVVGGQTLALGLMFILFGIIRTSSLWVAPPWVILVPLGLLILWSAARAPAPSGLAGRSA